MKTKKTIYILLVMFLGLLLAQIILWSIEIWLLNRLLNADLPAYLQVGLLTLGLVGGYFLGQTWWRIVYVEHRHWSRCSMAEKLRN